MTLKPEHAKALYQLLSAQGMDCSQLKNANPFSPEFDKTPTGRHIQMLVAAASPQLSMDLKREIGHADVQPSLAMAAAMADNIDPDTFTGHLKAEYLRSNPQAVQEQQHQQEKDLLAKLEKLTEASQRKREGDRAYEERLAREKAQQDAAARRAAEGRALEQRIKAKQQQMQNEGRIAMGNTVLPD